MHDCLQSKVVEILMNKINKNKNHTVTITNLQNLKIINI